MPPSMFELAWTCALRLLVMSARLQENRGQIGIGVGEQRVGIGQRALQLLVAIGAQRPDQRAARLAQLRADERQNS